MPQDRKVGSIGDRVSCNVMVEGRHDVGGTFDFLGGPPAVGDIVDIDVDTDEITVSIRITGRRWGRIPDGSLKATVWGEEVR